MLMCLRMMDEMDRRAGLYVSMNGTHSDLSVVMVVTLLGKCFVSGDVLCTCDSLSGKMSVATTFAGEGMSLLCYKL